MKKEIAEFFSLLSVETRIFCALGPREVWLHIRFNQHRKLLLSRPDNGLYEAPVEGVRLPFVPGDQIIVRLSDAFILLLFLFVILVHPFPNFVIYRGLNKLIQRLPFLCRGKIRFFM